MLRRRLKLVMMSLGFSILFGSLVAWLWIFSEMAMYGHVRLEEHDVVIWSVEVTIFVFGLVFVIWLFKHITDERVDYDPTKNTHFVS